jgi:hypothetical protein
MSCPVHPQWVHSREDCPLCPSKPAGISPTLLREMTLTQLRDYRDALTADRSSAVRCADSNAVAFCDGRIEAITGELSRRDKGPDPNCPSCHGTGEAPNAQFRCVCRYRPE